MGIFYRCLHPKVCLCSALSQCLTYKIRPIAVNKFIIFIKSHNMSIFKKKKKADTDLRKILGEKKTVGMKF